jgi:hypothetical protein
MSVKIWRFASIYLTAITLSLTFSHLLEMPRKLNYDQELCRSVQHTLYLYFAVVGAPAELGAVLCLGVLCFLVRGRGRSFWLTLTAAFCVGGGLAVWFAFVSPANAQMAQWTTLPLPESWLDTRRQWEFGHAASAILDLIGFAALIASVLFDPSLEPAQDRSISANG